jgi:putative transcriptional regulator
VSNCLLSLGLALLSLPAATTAGGTEAQDALREHLRIITPSYRPSDTRPPGPGPGMLLVADRELADPNFARTVVLLIDYNEHGALGLIINRRTEFELGEILPESEGIDGDASLVFEGGPVERGGLLLLVRADVAPERTEHVFDDVYFGRDRGLLEWLLQGEHRPRFRAYVGYAGWAAGQLDGEIERGGWHLVPAQADSVFSPRPGGLWQLLAPPDPAQSAQSIPDEDLDESISADPLTSAVKREPADVIPPS